MAIQFFISFVFICIFTACSPSQKITASYELHPEIEVKTDERVSDLCHRLEKEGYSDCVSFEKISESENYNYNFIPVAGSKNRFEGLFAPGKYVVSLVYFECKNIPLQKEKCSEERLRNTKIIISYLLEKSQERFKSFPSDKIRNWIILASIVEKEAASNKYYDKIASTFYNRMNQNMTLGSCPTVEYALGYHRPFLLFKDLELDSPYNVYKKKGLPPGPISFFSDEALSAVVKPIQTKYLFFVYDWTSGEMFFSENYEQHKRFAGDARKRFVEKFGKEEIHKLFPDKYYEL